MFPNTPYSMRSLSKVAIALAIAGLAGASWSAVQGEPDMVGEATLVIGVAKVVGADGVARVVDRGTAIRVGDRVETGAGGHVHVRFVDGGRLSVRPSSRLLVENYSRNVDQPGLTAIKFRLDEGVVRSITGAWGEAARDKFRLNTPVAAIGVKGTDFVVQSTAANTQASVYTGAIVLTPLSAACQASLGPCTNGSEKLLSEDMKGQMLSLNGLQGTPQLVAAVDLLAQRVRPAADAPAKQESVAIAGVGEKSAVIESRVAGVVATQALPAVAEAQKPPPVVQPPQPPQVTQLVWARLASIAAEGDAISRTYAQASATGYTAVAGNFANTLYRDGASGGTLTTAETSANFRLAGSAASLIWNDRGTDVVDAAQVNGGSLNVDFAHSTYATQLNVSSARIGSDTLVTGGAVGSNGFLRGSSNGVSTGGALSLDGKEAGYYFEKAYSAGQLRGITLWGR